MGRRGTKKTPIELKVARGTYRADRDGDLSELPQVSPIANVPQPPIELGSIGASIWVEKAPELMAAGLLTPLDLLQLADYCRAHDEIAKCDEMIAEHGELIATKDSMKANPAVGWRFQWLEVKRRIATEFGMTPSARSSIKVEKPKTQGIAVRKRNA